MQWKISVAEALNSLGFTNNDVAHYCAVSESMIRKVRNGSKKPSKKLEKRLYSFIKMKIRVAEGKMGEII